MKKERDDDMELLMCIFLAVIMTIFQLMRLKNIINGKEFVKIFLLIPLVLFSLIICIWGFFEMISGELPLHMILICYLLFMITIIETIGYIKQKDKHNN